MSGSRLEKMLTLLAAAAGVRVMYLAASLVLGRVPRYSVESAAVWFVVLGLLLALIRSTPRTSTVPVAPVVPPWTLIAYCGLAFALYWSSLGVGFLSDDFTLADRAARWSLAPITPSLFRPVPLAIWAIFFQAGAGAGVVHLFNVLLHGVNAYLGARVAERWLGDRTSSLLAGLLVVCSPLGPEAVVWASGVFDVLMTTLVLAGVLVARRYQESPSVRTRVAFLALAAGALLTKETAVVLPLLVLLDAWTIGVRSRRLLVDCALLLAACAVFGILRLVSAFGVAAPPVTKYIIQRAIFGAFGALAIPWHINDPRALPLAAVLILTSLLIAFFVTASRRRLAIPAAAAAWILISVVPVMSRVYVTPDLREARYLYLGSVGWAMLVVSLAAVGTSRRIVRRTLRAAIIALVTLSAGGVVLHLEPWREAAGVRDAVEGAAAASVEMKPCRVVALRKLPDSIDGAYIFRNGAPEAFANELGIHVKADAPESCTFEWDANLERFVSPPARPPSARPR